MYLYAYHIRKRTLSLLVVTLNMAIIYTNEEINELINERKPLPEDWNTQIYVLDHLDIKGDKGNHFRIYIRQDKYNPLDFSVILGVIHPLTTRVFRLRRYNGKTNPHTNRIERNEVSGFHIHKATERYQERGQKEDAYAVETKRYTDIKGAVDCLIADANFVIPQNTQLNLF